jgi:hypothetical protein
LPEARVKVPVRTDFSRSRAFSAAAVSDRRKGRDRRLKEARRKT